MLHFSQVIVSGLIFRISNESRTLFTCCRIIPSSICQRLQKFDFSQVIPSDYIIFGVESKTVYVHKFVNQH